MSSSICLARSSFSLSAWKAPICPASRFPAVQLQSRPSYSPSNLAYFSQTVTPMSSSQGETAVFSNGCFWGTEHMFRKYYEGKGLLNAKVGYTGGDAEQPTYTQVCQGNTGHAESVKLEFDPQKVTYRDLVTFFYRTHDASQLNYQGPDRGTQYRSAIFYLTEEQKKVADEVTTTVQSEHYTPVGKKIVTKIEKFGKWWDAEGHHQQCKLCHDPGGLSQRPLTDLGTKV